MANLILRPNGDISGFTPSGGTKDGNSWDVYVNSTFVAGGSASAALDDTAEQPNAADTTDYVSFSQAGPITAVMDLSTATVPNGQVVQSITVWANWRNQQGAAATASRTFGFQTKKADGTVLVNGSTTGVQDGWGWISATYNGTITQAEVDGMQLAITGTNSFDTILIAEMYVVVVTGLASGAAVVGNRMVVMTSSTTLMIPRGVEKLTRVVVIGGAGGSPAGGTLNGCGGPGGGASVVFDDVDVTTQSRNQTGIAVGIPTPVAGAAGGDTTFGSFATAKGGGASTQSAGGTGGTASGSTGPTGASKFNGGTGGAPSGVAGGGGGGGAGDNGAGGNGVASNGANTTGVGGAGRNVPGGAGGQGGNLAVGGAGGTPGGACGGSAALAGAQAGAPGTVVVFFVEVALQTVAVAQSPDGQAIAQPATQSSAVTQTTDAAIADATTLAVSAGHATDERIGDTAVQALTVTQAQRWRVVAPGLKGVTYAEDRVTIIPNVTVDILRDDTRAPFARLTSDADGKWSIAADSTLTYRVLYEKATSSNAAENLTWASPSGRPTFDTDIATGT